MMGDVTVDEGVTLTIEPCAQVQLAANIRIVVRGTLVAEGTGGKPIRFTALNDDPWRYILIDNPATGSLAYVTIENGGSDIVHRGASLVGAVHEERPVPQIVKVNHVTVKDSGGCGIWRRRYTGFTDDSSDLTITGSGKSDPDHPHPVCVSAQAMGTLPSGQYTGNAVDAIYVESFSGITTDVTVHDWGVPYYIDGSLHVWEDPALGLPPTLTIEAGVELQFEPGRNYELDIALSGSPGALQILGTATNPVIVTSAAAAPAPGDWACIEFGGPPGKATDLIRHARIEYAGGESGCSGWSCLTENEEYGDDGTVLIIGWRPDSAFITSTEFRHSAAHGVVRGWEGAGGPDFIPTNTFTNVAGCRQTNPSYVDCPPCD